VRDVIVAELLTVNVFVRVTGLSTVRSVVTTLLVVTFAGLNVVTARLDVLSVVTLSKGVEIEVETFATVRFDVPVLVRVVTFPVVTFAFAKLAPPVEFKNTTVERLALTRFVVPVTMRDDILEEFTFSDVTIKLFTLSVARFEVPVLVSVPTFAVARFEVPVLVRVVMLPVTKLELPVAEILFVVTVLLTTRFENTGVPLTESVPTFATARFDVPVLVRVVTFPVTKLELPDTEMFVVVIVLLTTTFVSEVTPVLVRVVTFPVAMFAVPERRAGPPTDMLPPAIAAETVKLDPAIPPLTASVPPTI
jgi:hypothetical protein